MGIGNKNELLKRINGCVFFDEPMLNHTTFHIGGPADIFVIPQNLDDIKYCILFAKEKSIPLYFVGNGSKLLVSDYGIRGMVIKIGKKMDHIKVSGDRIIAGAGVSISKIIRIAKRHDLSGIEFAFGIPGTLGGAVVMNAGTHLGSISEIVERVIVLNPTDGLQTTLSKDDCCFGYRDSVFQKNRLAILEVELKLRKGVIKAIEESLLKLLEKRERINS